MRFLIICFLFSAILSAQERIDLSTQYVWAESGLTMRAEGNAEGEKMMVIPFGAAVRLTGERGEYLRVKAMDAVRYEWGEEAAVGDAYYLNGNYVEVTYQGETGYVFNGYLFHYSPPVKGGGSDDFLAWIEGLAGSPDTICKGNTQVVSSSIDCLFQFSNGMTISYDEFEGGGSTTMTFPLGTRENGFLLAQRFWKVDLAVTNKKEFDEVGDYLPELLEVQDDGSLIFFSDMGEMKIMVVGNLLILYSAGWC